MAALLLSLAIPALGVGVMKILTSANKGERQIPKPPSYPPMDAMNVSLVKEEEYPSVQSPQNLSSLYEHFDTVPDNTEYMYTTENPYMNETYDVYQKPFQPFHVSRHLPAPMWERDNICFERKESKNQLQLTPDIYDTSGFAMSRVRSNMAEFDYNRTNCGISNIGSIKSANSGIKPENEYVRNLDGQLEKNIIPAVGQIRPDEPNAFPETFCPAPTTSLGSIRTTAPLSDAKYNKFLSSRVPKKIKKKGTIESYESYVPNSEYEKMTSGTGKVRISTTPPLQTGNPVIPSYNSKKSVVKKVTKVKAKQLKVNARLASQGFEKQTTQVKAKGVKRNNKRPPTRPSSGYRVKITQTKQVELQRSKAITSRKPQIVGTQIETNKGIIPSPRKVNLSRLGVKIPTSTDAPIASPKMRNSKKLNIGQSINLVEKSD